MAGDGGFKKIVDVMCDFVSLFYVIATSALTKFHQKDIKCDAIIALTKLT